MMFSFLQEVHQRTIDFVAAVVSFDSFVVPECLHVVVVVVVGNIAGLVVEMMTGHLLFLLFLVLFQCIY